MGARCKDGVVLISDSKVIRGTGYTHEEKIFLPFNEVVVGAAGLTGLFDKFLKQILIRTANRQVNFYDFVNTVEDVIREIVARYRERVGASEKGLLEALIAIQTQPKSELYHVLENGYAEIVQGSLAIGHGEPYGSIFLKQLWNKDMTMLETAKLGALIIKTIDDFGLDITVGGKPQIRFIPDKEKIREPTEDESKEIATFSMKTLKISEFFEELKK